MGYMEGKREAGSERSLNPRLGRAFPAVTVAAVLLLLYFAFPIWRASGLSGDEGMEFCKAFLLLKRPGDAATMWNDQPWLYTIVLSHLFSFFGSRPGVARVLTLASTGALLLSMLALLPKSVRWPGRLACVAFFISWTEIPALSVSAMCELPAQAVAITAVALALTGKRENSWWRPISSGALFGTALQLKFTAAIVFPAFLAAAWVAGVRRPRFWALWVSSFGGCLLLSFGNSVLPRLGVECALGFTFSG